MLKGIPPVLGPDALWALAAMGHGDRLAIVDRNYPRYSTSATGRVISLGDINTTAAIEAVCALFPLDTFEQPAYVMVPDPAYQATVGRLEAHDHAATAISAAYGAPIAVSPVERSSFYGEVRKCFATFTTTDDRPYSCFILVKGVV